MKNLFLLIFLSISISLFAKGTYEEPVDFINRVYNNEPPKAKKLWIKQDVRDMVNKVLGHDLKVLRLRYWDKESKRTWILEEIGRDKPITTGYVISDNEIIEISVLIFRESRGWEVRYPFFTDQFKGVTLGDKKGLNKAIDGITGATLSVNALTKKAQLALRLNKYLDNKNK